MVGIFVLSLSLSLIVHVLFDLATIAQRSTPTVDRIDPAHRVALLSEWFVDGQKSIENDLQNRRLNFENLPEAFSKCRRLPADSI